MRVFAAMLFDSYRELNSKKLFWITLIISGVFVIAYGSIGFDESGISLFYGLKHFESAYINSETPWSRALYMGIFSDFIVALWLGWIAVILALISTTTVFPDLVAGGSIDLVLSKPIRRITVFFTKYVTSLLFVLLQLTIFCAGVFLCVGLRIGEWNWLIFAAIPIVTVFFSYLYSVNVLLGVLTRSALTALLLTFLFWVGLWSVQSAEGILNTFRTQVAVQAEWAQVDLDETRATLDALEADGDEEETARRRERLERQIAELESDRDDALGIEQTLGRWHDPIRVAMAVLPKNAETVGLVSRWLKDPEGFSMAAMFRGEMTTPRSPDEGRGSDAEIEANRRIEAYYDARTPVFVIGTSLAFELVVLAIGCFIFVRRDY